jgi:predicted lipoprotein with Yx(FWY)xxD motif
MRPRLTFTAAALASAALLLGACGGDDNGSSSSDTAETVSVESIDGADVLVDSRGAALYTSEQEEDGRVRCVKSCASVWLPLDAPSGQPSAADDVRGELGVVERPDGTRQVTLDGAPVYRFADDGGPGEVTGDGLSDDFEGKPFTWHVLSAGGEEPASEPSESNDPYGGY